MDIAILDRYKEVPGYEEVIASEQVRQDSAFASKYSIDIASYMQNIVPFVGGRPYVVLGENANVGVVLDDRGRIVNGLSFKASRQIQTGTYAFSRNPNTGIYNPKTFTKHNITGVRTGEYVDSDPGFIVAPLGTRIFRQVYIPGQTGPRRFDFIEVTDLMYTLTELEKQGAVYLGES